MTVKVDVILPDGTHLYWSTHCRHGDHEACAATSINEGPRRPAQCKVCSAPCRCGCHEEQRQRVVASQHFPDRGA